MPGIKRHTAERSTDTALNTKAFNVSKNDWICLYVDLYRQTRGDSTDIDTIYTDALERLKILQRHGIV